MVRYKNKIFISLIAVLFFSFLFTVIGGSKADAASLITNEYPRGNKYIFLSQYGPGHSLETPDSYIRVFYDIDTVKSLSSTGGVQIKVDGYCRKSTGSGGLSPGYAEVTGVENAPNVMKKYFSVCPNTGNLNAPLTDMYFYVDKQNLLSNYSTGTTNFPSMYYPGYTYVDIRLFVGTDTPLAVKVTAMNFGGLATMRESSPNSVATNFNFSTNPPVTNYGATNPFPAGLDYATALWSHLNDVQEWHEFDAVFAPPCSTKSDVNTFLRWYDADFNNGAQSGTIYWRLYDTTTSWPGTLVASQVDAQLGGDDQYKDYPITVKAGHQYLWRWYHVDGSNGIQIWAPFSEINNKLRDTDACDPPTGSLSKNCSSTGTSHIYLNQTRLPYGGYVELTENGTTTKSRYKLDTILPLVASKDIPVGGPPWSLTTLTPVSKAYNIVFFAYNSGAQTTGITLDTDTIGPCSLPPPPVGDGDFNSVSCSNISFKPYWTPSQATNITGSVKITGSDGSNATKTFSIASNTTINWDPFATEFAGLPIHLPKYDVVVTVEGVNIGGTKSFGDCLSEPTCNPTNMEYGDPAQDLDYSVTNKTNKTADSRYTVSLSSPPGGLAPRSNSGVATPWIYTYPNYSPANSTNIVATLMFNNVAIAGKSSSPCAVTVHRFPYVKSYNGDVWAGGDFAMNNSCSPASSGIFARMRQLSQQSSNNKSGSGSQLASFTNGDQATGFTTAILRNTNPTAISANGLSFAGYSPIDTNSKEAQIGKSLTGSVQCIKDYFNDTRYSDPGMLTPLNNNAQINHGDGEGVSKAGKQTYITGNILTIVDQMDVSGGYSGRHTFYVDGDVSIVGNVKYATYSTLAQIPNFTLVVKGNIYIAPNVTQLDGVYIAQPKDDGTKGIIYTCHDGTTNFSANPSLNYTNCSGGSYGTNTTNQLVFNGSVIAKRIVLNRAVNTLSDSTFQERANTTKAAEVFNFSPEVLLSPPVFRAGVGVVNGTYNTLGILPPIL